MKIYQIIKTILYSIAGITIIAFHNYIFNIVDYVVGFVILLYGIDILFLGIFKKTLFKEEGILSQSITHILIGIVLLIIPNDLAIVCTIWAVWSILREGRELSECIKRFAEKKFAIFNTIESIIVIILSFMMILEPNEHHALLHIIILGIELILEILFPVLNQLIDKYIMKKRENV